MESIFLVCAIAGGVLLALQVLFTLLGGDVDGDADAGLDAEGGDDFVKLLSVKTLVAGATFFGLAGLAAHQFGASAGISLAIAATAGLTALYLVAHMMNALHRLQSNGTIDLENARGREARCYLRIPQQGQGTGRVTLTVQGRTIECDAVSTGPEIPTGTVVRVTALRSGATLEVVATGDTR